jgi:HSP20 family protein
MANLTRYNPFDDTFDDFFKGFFVRPMALESQAPAQAQFRMDVREDDGAYVVHADLPGVKKEDINITIDGNQVAVVAEAKRNREEKQGEKVLRTERYYGKLYRAFSLAQDVDDTTTGSSNCVCRRRPWSPPSASLSSNPPICPAWKRRLRPPFLILCGGGRISRGRIALRFSDQRPCLFPPPTPH